MDVKGKQIKNYVIGEPLLVLKDMQLLSGHRQDGQPISILMIEKKHVEQASFIVYSNLLQDNKLHIHPRYLEPIQSANNIYLILEQVIPLTHHSADYRALLPSIVELYRNLGEYKLEGEELFLTAKQQLVYLPFYKRINTSSKFYAQFHNKSVLGQIFAKATPLSNQNRALEIFLKHIDDKNGPEAIIREIQAETKQSKPLYPSVNGSMMEDEEKEDEEIMQLMDEVKVNSNMKKEAGNMFIRESARRIQQDPEKEMHSIMQNAQSSKFALRKATQSEQTKTRMEVKLTLSKVEGNQFEVYFMSYYESLRFLKRSLKKFLEHYRNGFAGIITAYLLVAVLALRKAYMVKDLECGVDIFELDIDMSNIPVGKYSALLKQELKSEARMMAQLRIMIENCQMPFKTYSILAPFLEENISLINLEQLQSFTFFFLTALIKGKELGKVHYMYVIDVMYILLHKNYEITFFESDFPNKWDSTYFQTKVALIQAILPNWSL